MTEQNVGRVSATHYGETLRPPMTLLEGISLAAVWAGGGMILFSAFLVTYAVLTRKFLGWSLGGADEISGYTFGVSTTWALSFTLLHRAHVRVDALYLRLGPRTRAALDLVSLLALGAFVTFAAWMAWGVFIGSWERDSRSITPLLTPLWIPQLFWFIGFAVFVVTFVMLFLRSLMAWLSGDLATVRRLAGTRTIDEDVEEELQGSASLAAKAR
jgi:TRAP-type mannitol/chloroaromatic compound transport system permease small subunit